MLSCYLHIGTSVKQKKKKNPKTAHAFKDGSNRLLNIDAESAGKIRSALQKFLLKAWSPIFDAFSSNQNAPN